MRILQLLNWPLRDIPIQKIADQGFDAVQISPLQPLKEKLGEWWLLYQPIGFYVGNELGSKEDLRKLCEKGKKHNVKIIADAICNHMAAGSNPLSTDAKVDKKLTDNPAFWKERVLVQNYSSRYECINYCIGLPGLNLNNEELQEIVLSFLKEYIACGVSGFRFDAGKHIALPYENCSFWEKIKQLDSDYNLFSYAEVLSAEPYMLYEYAQYVNVITDGWSANERKMIKFYESHDSFLTFRHTADASDFALTQGYRSISEHYPHTLFYARPFSALWESEEIKNINAIR